MEIKSANPAPRFAVNQGARSWVQPVPILALMAWGALLFLPFLGESPNRLLTPIGVYFLPLVRADEGAEAYFSFRALLWLLFCPSALILGAWGWRGKALGRRRLILAGGWLGFALLVWLAGDYAHQARTINDGLRVSIGLGMWAQGLIYALVGSEANRALINTPPPTHEQNHQPQATLRTAFYLALLAATMAIGLWLGHWDSLALMLEYRANESALRDALLEHLQMVLAVIVLSTFFGVGLGIVAYQRANFGRVVVRVLGIAQTIPGIALFALMLAPLSALGRAVPWLADLGVSGIGTLPAVMALLVYALLPVVHATLSGQQQTPPPILEAARGMGMSRRQVRWQVHLRLALPVMVAGIRVTAVQCIGLAVIGALIGAGGLGTFVFRGLSASALDLVLLGVIPLVLMAALADGVFRGLEHLVRPIPIPNQRTPS